MKSHTRIYVCTVFIFVLLFSMTYPTYAQDRSDSRDGEVIVYQKATKGDGIDIIFLGDAFTEGDLIPDGKFETCMEAAYESFFHYEPIKSLRDYFNIYAVKSVSAEGDYNGEGSTCFNMNPQRLRDTDWEKCKSYCRKAPLVDTDRFGFIVISTSSSGMGVQTRHKNIICSAGSFKYDEAGNIITERLNHLLGHELIGHGIGMLDDERPRIRGYIPASVVRSYERRPKWGANIDFTNDPEKIKWSAFLKNPDYKNSVGI